MTLHIRQQLDFAGAHRHGPAGRLHGHNFQLSTTVAGEQQASGVVLDAATLAARLAELQSPEIGNESIEAVWLRARADWPAAVRAQAVTLLETSGAGSTVEAGQRLFVSPGYFSAAHRTHAPRLSDPENLALYGICDNPAGHGHNYRVTVWHPALAQMPAAVWAEFDHRNLSVDIPALRGRNVVTETIAALIAERVPGAERVRVWETDTFYAEFKPATGAYQLGRRFQFSAAHQIGDPRLTDSENQSRYGRCAAAGLHGHDFALEVVVGTDGLDPLTETAFDLGLIDQAAAAVLAQLHEVDLDRDVPWLSGQRTTPEVLASTIYDRLARDLGGALRAVGVWAEPDHEAWSLRGSDGK